MGRGCNLTFGAPLCLVIGPANHGASGIMVIRDLFLLTLKDIYFAERQLVRALPTTALAARAGGLKHAFSEHREQALRQVERLQKVFEIFGKRAAGQPCGTTLRLIEESEALLDQAPAPATALDTGPIADGEAVEHYKIARYTTLLAWAQLLDESEIAALVGERQPGQNGADGLLATIAQTSPHHGRAEPDQRSA